MISWETLWSLGFSELVFSPIGLKLMSDKGLELVDSSPPGLESDLDATRNTRNVGAMVYHDNKKASSGQIKNKSRDALT